MEYKEFHQYFGSLSNTYDPEIQAVYSIAERLEKLLELSPVRQLISNFHEQEVFDRRDALTEKYEKSKFQQTNEMVVALRIELRRAVNDFFKDD